MMRVTRSCFLAPACCLTICLIAMAPFGCLGPGASEELNCGDHGHEQDGTCDCDAGYIYDGEKCVPKKFDGGSQDAKDASQDMNCGSHGAPHGEHCHCDPGYAFNGVTCVVLSDIEEQCHALNENEHEHGVCVCPLVGDCPCEGSLEEQGGQTYCIPDLHEL